MSFYWISPKIDRFQNPSLKIDGFGRTHRTHADEAPASSVDCSLQKYKAKFDEIL